jgi:hypothetical protein
MIQSNERNIKPFTATYGFLGWFFSIEVTLQDLFVSGESSYTVLLGEKNKGPVCCDVIVTNRDASISRNAINSRDAKNNSSGARNDGKPIAK